MRFVVRALTAAFLTAAGLMLTMSAVQASVQGVQQSSARTYPAASHSLTISIDGMTPQWVTSSTSSVTVRGTLSNHTGSAISGVAVQVLTSSQPFGYPSAMTVFANGGGFPYPLSALPGTVTGVAAVIPNGATVHWSVSFGAAAYSSAPAGVYPIEAQAFSPSGYQASSQTFLPYWPSASTAKQLQVAWLWPLVDTPQQGACPRTLATASLAGSLSAGGRLSRLLETGQDWAKQDQVTWMIDPALLSDASVMTHPYFTGGNSACTGRTRRGASPGAKSWLSALRAETPGEPAFLTPYANVDVAALSHAGLDGDLRSAYRLGEAVASKILPRTFGTSGAATGASSVLPAAWPAGGNADSEVLTSLANDGGIKTVVLNSGELPTSTPFDNALARTTSGIGTPMSVLLADSELTTLLGSASASSPRSAQFAVTQGFLARTAMVVAEAPNAARSLVAAPPVGWAPSQQEATKLLWMTHNAPWLRATALGTLATEAEAGSVAPSALPVKKHSHAELPDAYLDQVRSAEANLDLFTGLLYRPSQGLLSSLQAALTATESSAWRGRGSPGGWLAVSKFTHYLTDEENKVQLIASKKILLAGTSGTTPVSVQNGLGTSIQVRVRAVTQPGSKLAVGPVGPPLVVAPGKTGTVRLPVNSAAIGTTMMKLQLVTRNGSPLTWTAQPLSVEVTRFGRALLLLIGGSLAVLVLTTGVRLQRRRLAAGRYRGGTNAREAPDD